MRTGSTGVKLDATNTVLTVPENRVYRLVSLYITSVHVDEQQASVYIKKGGAGDDYYLVKDALIKTQSTYQIVSKEVFLEEGDELHVDISLSGSCDCFVSYEEKYKY